MFDSEPENVFRNILSHGMLSAGDLQRLALGKESSQQGITTLIRSMPQAHRSFPQYDPARSLSGNIIRGGGAVGATATYHHQRRFSGQACVSIAACKKDFAELVELATQHYLFDREKGCNDPLYVAEELAQLKSAEFSECKACARSLELWASREREKLWKLIPTWFHLDPW
jgi:hypothetical protein